MDATYKTAGHTVELSHLDKLYFPEDGISKGDVVEYFERVAPLMLEYLCDRPLMMQRFPEGIKNQSFYQKQVPEYFPDWIETVVVERKGSEDDQELVLCNNTETLIYLVNQGCFTFHPWLSRKDRLDEPDRAIIDLDPSGQDNDRVRQAARVVVSELKALDLEVFATTTGSSGYHLILPLRRGKSFDEVRADLGRLTHDMESNHSSLLTTQHRVDKRGGKVYLDIARNGYAQTSVGIYSVRALPGAPVATPISLNELERSDLDPQKYTIKNLFRRLAQKDDPWQGLWAGPTHQRL